MITLSRAVARRWVSLLGKTFGLSRELLKRQAVRFQVDSQGMKIESATATHALRYRDSTYRGLPQVWEAPLEALQHLARSVASSGEYFLQGEAQVLLRVVEKGIPREEGFSAPEVVLEAPASPESGYLMPLTARQALIAAFETAEQGYPGRYALNQVQLQGSRAALAATDGRQLLIQKGLHWPFEEDLLLGNYRQLFRCGDFPEGPLELSKTEQQVLFRVGEWEFFLPFGPSQRYPSLAEVFPSPSEAVATMEISKGDAQYLRGVLSELPFEELDDEKPVTLELQDQISVRARSRKSPAGIEVVLRNSVWRGVAVCCAMKREYLQRALDLGLREFQFFSSSCAPVVVRGGDKTYCWATYHPDSLVRGTPETERRESPLEVAPSRNSTFTPQKEASHALVITSRISAAQKTSRRRNPCELRATSRASRRTALWRWSDAAKAG